MIYNGELKMKTERIDMDGVNNLFKTDGMFLAGQPSLESIDEIKNLGVSTIINLRSSGEVEYSPIENRIKELGMDYHNIPIVVHGVLDAKACEIVNNLIDDDHTYFIHCGSANRVGGWLITYLVTKKGLDFESAVDIAQKSGLTNVGFIEQAQTILGV